MSRMNNKKKKLNKLNNNYKLNILIPPNDNPDSTLVNGHISYLRLYSG